MDDNTRWIVKNFLSNLTNTQTRRTFGYSKCYQNSIFMGDSSIPSIMKVLSYINMRYNKYIQTYLVMATNDMLAM